MPKEHITGNKPETYLFVGPNFAAETILLRSLLQCVVQYICVCFNREVGVLRLQLLNLVQKGSTAFKATRGWY